MRDNCVLPQKILCFVYNEAKLKQKEKKHIKNCEKCKAKLIETKKLKKKEEQFDKARLNDDSNYCKSCLYEISSNNRFCSFCGNKNQLYKPFDFIKITCDQNHPLILEVKQQHKVEFPYCDICGKRIL